MVRVCACLWCGGFSWTASARRCARARACAVVREFADGAGAVRRVSRPPTEKFMHGTPARTLCADRYSVSSIYGVLVLCFTFITITYKSIQKNETTFYRLFTMVCVLMLSATRTVSVAVGACSATWGRYIGSVNEYFLSVPPSKFRPVRRRRYVRSRGADPGRRTRVRVRSSLCVVLPAGGRRAGVVSSRVILLLRCLRIRRPTGPANLCTGGRLPSNGEICMRGQRSRGTYTVCTTSIHLLLAASAATASQASSHSCAHRSIGRAAGTSVPRTPRRCCACHGVTAH